LALAITNEEGGITAGSQDKDAILQALFVVPHNYTQRTLKDCSSGHFEGV
jgi:hypothetical protein